MKILELIDCFKIDFLTKYDVLNVIKLIKENFLKKVELETEGNSIILINKLSDFSFIHFRVFSKPKKQQKENDGKVIQNTFFIEVKSIIFIKK